MRLKLGRHAAIAGGVVAVCLLVALAAALHFRAGSRISKGVSVAGINIGGMEAAQANQVLRSWAIKQAYKNVTLTAMDRRWVGNLASFGVRMDWQEAAHRAYSIGRKDFSPNSILCALTSTGVGKTIVPKLLIDRSRLRKTIVKVSRAVNVPHRDARIRRGGDGFVIQQDSCGIKLDEKLAEQRVTNGIRLGQSVIALPVITDKPDVTAADAATVNTLLAQFTTSFNAAKRGRTHNLTLAARSINGIILRPGQVFSYNDAVGPRIEGRGFQMAQVYVKGKLEDGIGGGICQVSSTLFNSVLLAGLKICERSPHCQVVPYVSPGRDATVAYGHRDFRFENTNSAPIGVISSVSGSRLTVSIYGSAPDRKTVELYTGRVKRVTAGCKTVTSAALPAGARQLVEKGANGCEVVLYRKIVQPDGSCVVDSIRSRYAPQKAVFAVGAPSVPASQ